MRYLILAEAEVRKRYLGGLCAPEIKSGSCRFLAQQNLLAETR